MINTIPLNPRPRIRAFDAANVSHTLRTLRAIHGVDAARTTSPRGFPHSAIVVLSFLTVGVTFEARVTRHMHVCAHRGASRGASCSPLRTCGARATSPRGATPARTHARRRHDFVRAAKCRGVDGDVDGARNRPFHGGYCAVLQSFSATTNHDEATGGTAQFLSHFFDILRFDES